MIKTNHLAGLVIMFLSLKLKIFTLLLGQGGRGSTREKNDIDKTECSKMMCVCS